jgi:RimJ/RimL family protein N-acetyltransferase
MSAKCHMTPCQVTFGSACAATRVGNDVKHCADDNCEDGGPGSRAAGLPEFYPCAPPLPPSGPECWHVGTSSAAPFVGVSVDDGKRPKMTASGGAGALAGKEQHVHLRDVELGDVSAYVRMRCDPVMMAELGGPLPREGIEEKVARDVHAAAAGEAWIKMIIPGEAAREVAGSVALWSHDEDGGEPIAEIGWMVLPEFQGRGLAKQAAGMLLGLARDDGRWGLVHAFPATTNSPSNGICRSLGFTFAGERDVSFAGRVVQSNHWVINPATDLS